MRLFENAPAGWANPWAALEAARHGAALALCEALIRADTAPAIVSALVGHLPHIIQADYWHWREPLSEEDAARRTITTAGAAAWTATAQSGQDAAGYLLAVDLSAESLYSGRLVGVRSYQPDVQPFNLAEAALLTHLAGHAVHALARLQRLALLEQLSFNDELTRLYNARYLRDYLAKELARARRQNEVVAALFLDLDDFKFVNDAHGHLVGSHILQEFSELILATVRNTDMAARYGGDEFVVILPSTDLAAAALVAERLRRRLAQYIFHGGQGLRLALTASFGVACYPLHAHTPQELIARADAAMYEAKAAGKNRLCLAPMPATP